MAEPQNADLNEERELLEEELLPLLENLLDEYVVVNQADDHQEHFQEVLDGNQSFGNYALPTILTPEYGILFPEYFVKVHTDSTFYLAAIEPHTKYIDIRDESLVEPLRDFAEAWKEKSYIDEIDLGKADVSQVTFAHNEPRQEFAERL